MDIGKHINLDVDTSVDRILDKKRILKQIEINESDEEYEIGDRVSSVGGFFIDGIVKEIDNDILTIIWIKDSRRDEAINFVQKRSKRIVKKLNV